MPLLKDISTSQEHRKTATITTHVNMERIDRWHLWECGLPFPRGRSVRGPPFSVRFLHVFIRSCEQL